MSKVGNWNYGGSCYTEDRGFDAWGNLKPGWSMESALATKQTGFNSTGGLNPGWTAERALGESARLEQEAGKRATEEWNRAFSSQKTVESSINIGACLFDIFSPLLSLLSEKWDSNPQTDITLQPTLPTANSEETEKVNPEIPRQKAIKGTLKIYTSMTPYSSKQKH